MIEASCAMRCKSAVVSIAIMDNYEIRLTHEVLYNSIGARIQTSLADRLTTSGDDMTTRRADLNTPDSFRISFAI